MKRSENNNHFTESSRGGIIPSSVPVTAHSTNSQIHSEISREYPEFRAISDVSSRNHRQQIGRTIQEDEIEQVWACLLCTFHNPRSVRECAMCGSPAASLHGLGSNMTGGSAFPQSFSNRDERHFGERDRDRDPLDAEADCRRTMQRGVDWTCVHCTFHNSTRSMQCEVCDSVRPPEESYRDTLLSERAPLGDPMMRPGGYEGNWRGASLDDFSFRGRSRQRDREAAPEEPSLSPVFTGAVLGALGGAGVAFMSGRNVSTGLLAGASVGGLVGSMYGSGAAEMPPHSGDSGPGPDYRATNTPRASAGSSPYSTRRASSLGSGRRRRHVTRRAVGPDSFSWSNSSDLPTELMDGQMFDSSALMDRNTGHHERLRSIQRMHADLQELHGSFPFDTFSSGPFVVSDEHVQRMVRLMDHQQHQLHIMSLMGPHQHQHGLPHDIDTMGYEDLLQRYYSCTSLQACPLFRL